MGGVMLAVTLIAFIAAVCAAYALGIMAGRRDERRRIRESEQSDAEFWHQIRALRERRVEIR